MKKIKYVCVNPKTIECDKKLEPIATLSGKADQYYVVVFPKETKEIREMFEKFGYLSDDIFYINHCPIRVEKDGTDKYGNTLKGFNNLKNKSILVFFEGYEASVCMLSSVSRPMSYPAIAASTLPLISGRALRDSSSSMSCAGELCGS